MRNALLAVVLLVCSSVSAATYVVPVVTAKVKDRTYSTTLALRNDGTQDVSCEAIYAVPNDPKGGTLRATYTVPAGGRPRVEEDVLMEVGAVGTMRLACLGEVAIAARIQSSTDGGSTFDEGRTFAALDEAASFRRLRTLTARTDLLVAEVTGNPVTFEAVVKNDAGAVIGRKSYEVPAFAQQLVNLSKVREDVPAPHVELRIVAGTGALVAGEETRDPALLKMAVRMTPEGRRAFEEHLAVQLAAATASASTGPSITEQLLISPFKAAPFRDPATGLVFMRDRWYDPSTGTFLTPDPEGYADSSNPYIYCGGDPVNCSDPTGRLGDGGDLRNDFRMKEQAEAARRHAIWCAQNPVECKKLEVRGRGMLRMVGGVGQTTAGAGAVLSTGPLPEPVTKTLGGTALVRGIDNTITGAVETWTGTPRDTVTGRAIYLALVKGGMSPAQASKITGWTEVGVDVVSTLGASVVPSVNTALRIRPAGGVINVGGTGEAGLATNLNPLIGETGGQTSGIPNLVRGRAEDMGRFFVERSATRIISNRLPGFSVTDWNGFARGAYSTLQEGGMVDLNIYLAGSAAEQQAVRAAALAAFRSAGFRNVSISGENVGTFLKATR